MYEKLYVLNGLKLYMEVLLLVDCVCVQLFYVVTEQYSLYAGRDLKDMRRWAYEIYSSFLVEKAVSCFWA